MTDPSIPLAAELALGLLEGEERAEALRRVLADAAFAREVERWRGWWGELFAEWPDVAPEAAVEARVMAALDRPSSPERRWRWATGIATAVAACLLLALLLRPERIVELPPTSPAAAPAPLVAAIAPTSGKPFAAVYDIGHGSVRLGDAVARPNGRDAELWVIGSDGVPHALGVLAPNLRITVAGPNRDRLAEGVTLAISIEPEGGSPTGLPTGPVVATGTLVRL